MREWTDWDAMFNSMREYTTQNPGHLFRLDDRPPEYMGFMAFTGKLEVQKRWHIAVKDVQRCLDAKPADDPWAEAVRQSLKTYDGRLYLCRTLSSRSRQEHLRKVTSFLDETRKAPR